jgi:hypothetical protein
MEPAVRLIRLIQIAMLASIALYVLVGELVGRHQAPENTLFHALSLVSIILVGSTLVVRRTLVLPSELLLNQKPGDSLTLARWKSGYLTQYAMCEALGLLGLVLRLVGFSFSQVWGFYLGGFLLLLLFSPRAAGSRFR